jgi:hypothetical protein
MEEWSISWPASAPALCAPDLMAFVAAAITHDNVPGKRHDSELELSRTFSSGFVRDLQSPDRVRAVRAAFALGRTKKLMRVRSPNFAFSEAEADVRAFAMWCRGRAVAFAARGRFTHGAAARRCLQCVSRRLVPSRVDGCDADSAPAAGRITNWCRTAIPLRIAAVRRVDAHFVLSGTPVALRGYLLSSEPTTKNAFSRRSMMRRQK